MCAPDRPMFSGAGGWACCFSTSGATLHTSGRWRPSFEVDSVAMRALAAVVLLAALVAVPPLDLISCPDGCTDSSATTRMPKEGSCRHQAGCGACQNGLALHIDAIRAEPVLELIPVTDLQKPRGASVRPQSIDPPPKPVC